MTEFISPPRSEPLIIISSTTIIKLETIILVRKGMGMGRNDRNS